MNLQGVQVPSIKSRGYLVDVMLLTLIVKATENMHRME